MKILRRLAYIVISLVLILSAGIYLFLRHSIAPMDGELKLQGLSQKVTVTRDNYGIPHIKAQNKLDALRALGFVMASERLFQMELSRRLTQGRLAEVFGPLAIPADKLYRSLMLRRTAERMIEHLKNENLFDQQTWTEMQAYYDGINQYVRTQPLPYEFKLLKIQPEEFQPMDAYIMTGHMAYMFGIALKSDPLMTELAKKLSKEQFQSLRTDILKQEYKVVQTVDAAKARTIATAPLDFMDAPFFEGSNAWLLGPSRSASGKSLFANDPHIGFSNPAIWVEAHIQTPEFELYGHYLPLVPFAILGHNRHHAWGFTMSLIDDMDLFKEKLDRTTKTAALNGKNVPYQEWQEVIKVKDEADIVLDMIETSHGPLMNHATDIPDLSLKWAFHAKTNDVMTALRKLGAASTMGDFEKGLMPVTAPGLNVMYADAENIAWWTVGEIAKKKNPNSDMILDGASGDDEYLSILPWKDHPQSVNPKSGVIVTANSRPDSLAAEIRGDWQPDDRFHTISQLLSEKPLWSAEQFKKLQTMNFNKNSQTLSKLFIIEVRLTPEESAKYKDIIEKFKQWDHHSEIDSYGASIFHLWMGSTMQVLLKDLSAEEREVYLSMAAPWTAFKRIMLDEKSVWFSKHSRSDIVTEGFREMVKRYPQIPRWGEIHTIEFYHPLGRKKPLDKIFNIGPFSIPGGYNEINNNKYWSFAGPNFNVTAGPSTRRIIDMASPEKSWGINPIGISGHILSPYHHDQVQMFIHGQYRDQLMNEQDIQSAKTHELTLIPGL